MGYREMTDPHGDRVHQLQHEGFGTEQQCKALLRILGVPEDFQTIQVAGESTEEPDPVGTAAQRNSITIDAPRSLTVDPTNGGNQTTWDTFKTWSTRLAFAQDVADYRALIDIVRSYVPFDQVTIWCDLGSEITKYDFYHELADVTALCPYSVDTGEPDWEQETWETWGVASNGSHKPIEINGVWYRDNRYGQGGTKLTSSQWYGFITAPDTANTGITRILTLEEFQDIQAAANPTP